MKRTRNRRGNGNGTDLVFSIPLPYGLLYVRGKDKLVCVELIAEK